jgi:hypothetical protein
MKSLKKKFKPKVNGHLDMFVSCRKYKFEGKTIKRDEIFIHGDPEGLKSFAKLLVKIANQNQALNDKLPEGERGHVHLEHRFDLSNSSCDVIVGRLDAKGTGEFYDRYIPKSYNRQK